MKGAPIKSAMAAARAFLAERKKDLPVAIVVFGPDDTRPHGVHDGPARLADAVAKTPDDGRGHAHLRRADQGREHGEVTQGLERTTVVLLSDGANYDASDAARRGPAAARRRERPRHLGRSQLAAVRRRRRSRGSRSAPAARTSSPRRPRSSSRSSRRSGSSSRASTRSRTDRCFRRSANAVVLVKVAGLTPATAKYTTPALDLTPREPSRRAGSTR